MIITLLLMNKKYGSLRYELWICSVLMNIRVMACDLRLKSLIHSKVLYLCVFVPSMGSDDPSYSTFEWLEYSYD